MKVLRVSQEYYPLISGPTKQAHNISRQLIRQGHESPVLTTTAGTTLPPGADEIDGVPIYRLPVKGRIMRCYFAPTLHRELDLSGVDVVHVHGWQNYLSEYTMRRARQHRIPVVLHAHGMAGLTRLVISGMARLPYWGYDLVRRRAVIGATDALVVSTRQERDEAIAYGFPAEKIAIIPSGVDVPLASPRGEDPERQLEPLKVLFVGRLAPHRNVEQIIRAVALLRDGGTNVTLRIVGPEERVRSFEGHGYVETLQDLVAELRLDDRVTFAGEQRRQELNEEYAEADLFVATSRYENFGNAVLEAAAYGLPLITTPTGVGPDLVAATGAGRVVPIDDPATTASAIKGLMQSAVTTSAGRLTLRKHVAQTYAWEKIGTAYLALYQSCTLGQLPVAVAGFQS
jgi:glycosyltransferase involved in cell wall biosynthesis